jgi:transcriptional regulator with XRE-family HTH domain
MTNFEIARRFTGLTASALAELLEVSPQQLNGWIQGARVPSRTNVDGIASRMGVDPAWLLGVAQSLPVLDHASGVVYSCPIIHSAPIEGYGMFYVVWLEEIGAWLPVVQGDGVQFTPWDWQSADNARGIADVATVRWVDHRGHEAVMVDGMPRVML